MAITDTAFTIGLDTISFLGGTDQYVGYIDEVRLFNEALTTAAIQQEMSGGLFDLEPEGAGRDALLQWVEKGGLLIRFAGPRLAGGCSWACC